MSYPFRAEWLVNMINPLKTRNKITLTTITPNLKYRISLLKIIQSPLNVPLIKGIKFINSYVNFESVSRPKPYRTLISTLAIQLLSLYEHLGWCNDWQTRLVKLHEWVVWISETNLEERYGYRRWFSKLLRDNHCRFNPDSRRVTIQEFLTFVPSYGQQNQSKQSPWIKLRTWFEVQCRLPSFTRNLCRRPEWL